jgi:hypothetical protein
MPAYQAKIHFIFNLPTKLSFLKYQLIWFCHQGQDTDFAPQNLRLSKPTDMTIHWKGLEEHFLMVPLDFQFNHFWRQNQFSEFFSKLFQEVYPVN